MPTDIETIKKLKKQIEKLEMENEVLKELLKDKGKGYIPYFPYTPPSNPQPPRYPSPYQPPYIVWCGGTTE